MIVDMCMCCHLSLCCYMVSVISLIVSVHPLLCGGGGGGGGVRYG